MFKLLKNLIETLLEKSDNKEKGTYVGAKFSKQTVDDLSKMITKLKIPNPISKEDFHTTIIFSRKRFPEDFKALGKLKELWIGIPTSLDIFTGRNGQKCLVLKYTCKEQKERHEYLMNEYDATYDWPEYKIHLTLSYDCGDFDSNINIKDYIEKIEIEKEYTEDLDLNWLVNKDKKDN